MLKFLKERIKDYDANIFMNELFEASKFLGILEAKISGYHFDGILIPLLHKREAQSTMYIEGTQTTLSDAFEDEIREQPSSEKAAIELRNHSRSIIKGSEYLLNNSFSHSFIKSLHKQIMDGIVPPEKQNTLGKYKISDNAIVNSAGTLIFSPPSYTETKKYMDELINYMNDSSDGVNPLVKAAIIHSQFESIHPFDDGNGRVGRLLISLYLYKAGVINCPFFYMSEAISQDKLVYYNMLTASRNGSYTEWISFFLKKCVVQARSHISYIDSLNDLYEKTKRTLQNTISTPKFDQILECLFTHPVLTVSYLSDYLGISANQTRRYIDALQSCRILHSDDRKRSKTYFFVDLLDLSRRL